MLFTTLLNSRLFFLVMKIFKILNIKKILKEFKSVKKNERGKNHPSYMVNKLKLYHEIRMQKTVRVAGVHSIQSTQLI